MSKFTSLIATFKNGMISPRLRGSIIQEEDKSSAEQLENFIVDRTGSAIKRPGLGYIESNTYYAGLQHFNIPFLGTDYLFTFNPNIYFNAIDASYVSTFLKTSKNVRVFSGGRNAILITSHTYIGADITLLTPSGHGILAGDIIKVSGLVNTTNSPNGTQTVTSVDATHIFYTYSAIPTGVSTLSTDGAYLTKTDSNNNSDMNFWNGHHETTGFTYVDSKLSTLLQTFTTIRQWKQVSERTVLFIGSTLNFYVSLLDVTYSNQTVRQFYIYPDFVSGVLLNNMIGKYIGDNVKCPIVPSNYPFNPVNTDVSLTISAAIVANQNGTPSASGIVGLSTGDKVWLVTVPRSLAYQDGNVVNFEGRFISMPSAAATEDVVFFLTHEFSQSSTTITYYAIQCISGIPATGSAASQWKISTWGKSSYPRAVNYCFGRIVMGNIPSAPSTWWASALHPSNPLYTQGFMTTNLLQDDSSDVSGINYSGVAAPTVTTPNLITKIKDIYRFGFSDRVPSLGAISWISSRRNIHLGTDRGECQISILGGSYNSPSYSQIRVGTTDSSIQSYWDVLGETISNVCEGDRKIFYISESGKGIRFISTEDRDYDSIDNLLTVSLIGLNLIFTKIEWIESLHALICLTSTGRLFILSIHSDTKIKAFSELVSVKTILDFTGLYIFLKDSSNILTTKMSLDLSTIVYPSLPVCYGDLYLYSVGVYPNFSMWYSSTIYVAVITTTGVLTKVQWAVPAVPVDADFTAAGLPIPSSLTTETVFVYKDLLTAKLRTMPIREGAKFGPTVGDIQRIDRVSVLIDSSGSFKYGSSSSNVIDAEGLTTYSNTVIKNIDFPQSPDVECIVYIESSDPTPLNISGISLRGVSYSGE
jgi:hypothetical protein